MNTLNNANMKSNELQVIEVKLPQKISTNLIYGGVHWVTRKKHKDLFVWSFLEVASKIRPVESCNIEFEFEFKSKPLDCDNCSYMAKLYIDCLRHYGKLKDDTPKYLKSIKITSKKGNSDKVKIILDN